MFSRRSFLLGSLGLAVSPAFSLQAYAKKASKQRVANQLHSLVRQEWPPAIMPNEVKFIEKGYSCFTDEFGHLAIVDLRKSSDPRVVGELPGIGKKVLDFAIVGHTAWALVFQDSAAGDPQYMLLSISLAPASQPTISARFPLEQFSEPSCLVTIRDLVCVAGTSSKGEDIVAVYALSSKQRLPELKLQSTFATSGPVVKMDFQGKHLVLLESFKSSHLMCVDMTNPNAPQLRRRLKLDGDFQVMSGTADLLLVAGQTLQGHELKLIALEPIPHAVSSLPLAEISVIHDAIAQKDSFLILAEHDSTPLLIPVSVDKRLEMTPELDVSLPVLKQMAGAKLKFAVKDQAANVVFGQSSVQVLNFDRTGWHHTFTYNIPRLPASGLAVFDHLAIVGGANLALYDFANPEKPVLKETISSGSTVRSISSAGNQLLCLNKHTLSLRNFETLNNVVASIDMSGQQMTYDPDSQKAYIMVRDDKKTTITPVSMEATKLSPAAPLELPASYQHIFAKGGQFASASLTDLALYDSSQGFALLGSRHFESQAVRALCLTEKYLVVTVVDHNSKGYLIILSKQAKDQQLPLLGAVDLPCDGTALAVANDRAVVVGQSPDGQDLAAVINLSSPGLPRVISQAPVVEAASAVAIKDQLAIVVGRGLEILSLG